MSYTRLAVFCIATVALAVPVMSTALAQATPATAAPAPAAPAAPAATKPVPTTRSAAEAAKTAPPKPVKKVDINNASVAELKTQLVIDEEYAKKIVANRPYKSKGELVTKAGLPEGVYHAIKRKVEMRTPREPAKQPAKPPAK